MTLETWALFCLVEFLLCLKPGPSCMVVISLGLTRGQAAGVLATTGVLAANAIYFAVSATGVAAALSLPAQVFVAIKWLGAAYLVWVGARMIARSFWRGDAAASPPSAAAPGRAFWQGFVSQGANPTLIVYFTAILPQFIDTAAPLAWQVAVLALSSFSIEFAVLSAYSALSHRAGQRTGPRFHRIVDRLGGSLLIAAGAGLARIERD